MPFDMVQSFPVSESASLEEAGGKPRRNKPDVFGWGKAIVDVSCFFSPGGHVSVIVCLLISRCAKRGFMTATYPRKF